jgi:hypothetical protein
VTVTTTVQQRNSDGSYTPVNPDTLTLAVTAPDGTVRSYSSPSSAGTGSFYQDIPVVDLPVVGRYRCLWTATGLGSGTSYTTFDVYDPALDGTRTYTDVDTLKDSLHITDVTRDDLLARAVTSGSRSIDKMCGRRFWLDETAAARILRPQNHVVCDVDGARLLVPDIGSLDDLVVELGSAAAGWSDVTSSVEPVEPELEGWPYMSLLRSSWSLTSRVRVTARWGWPAVPDEISQAALIQASRLFKRKDSPEGIAGSAEWGVIRLGRTDPDVAALIGPYTLPGIA